MRSEPKLAERVTPAHGRRLGVFLDASRPPTLADIAREAGCSRQFVWRIVNGRARPTQAVLDAMRRLGIDVDLALDQ